MCRRTAMCVPCLGIASHCIAWRCVAAAELCRRASPGAARQDEAAEAHQHVLRVLQRHLRHPSVHGRRCPRSRHPSRQLDRSVILPPARPPAVRPSVRARVRACGCVCVRVQVRACVCVRACARIAAVWASRAVRLESGSARPAGRSRNIARVEKTTNIMPRGRFDPPDDPKEYIHRVGRTARGIEGKGKAPPPPPPPKTHMCAHTLNHGPYTDTQHRLRHILTRRSVRA